MKRFVLILTMLFSSLGFTSTLYKSSVLFIAQDAGEAYAFLPILKENRFDYYILAGGVAYDILEKEKDIPAGALLSFDKLGHVALMNRHVARDTVIDSAMLAKMLCTFDPQAVVAGVAYHFQGQFLKAFRQEGIKTYAFWDNFSPDGEDPYFTVAHRVKEEAESVFVPTEEFLGHAKFTSCQLICVEHPTIQVWKDVDNRVNKREIRHRYNIADKKFVAFIGGYGEEYEKAFRLFLQGAKLLGDDVKIIVKPHPKMGGEFERMALFAAGLHSSVVLGASCEFTTQEIALAADVVVTYMSTVGVQAALCGKQTLFVIPKGDKYTNFVIRLGLGHAAQSAEQVRQKVACDDTSKSVATYTQSAIQENLCNYIVDTSLGR